MHTEPMKQILKLFLIVVLLLGIIPALSVAATGVIDGGTCGTNVTWELDDAGTLTISGEGETDWYSSINDTNGRHVPWIDYRQDIKKVIVNEGVTGITSYAFEGCTNLTEVTLPTGLESLEYATFADCSSLTKINIPDTVTQMDGAVFKGCSSLKQISLPAGMTEMRTNNFEQCTSLESIVWPENVKKIPYATFYACTSLKSITLPEGLEEIDTGAFESCTSLTQIHIPESVQSILGGAFSGCRSLKKINIPEGITYINNYTFYECESLEEIVLPEGVLVIDNGAFSGCSMLREINLPDSVHQIGSSAFSYCSSLSYIKLPADTIYVGDMAFQQCVNLVEADFSGNLTYLNGSAFSGCQKLEKVTLPEKLHGIGKWAFMDCESLKEVLIPASVRNIEYGAFGYCYALEMITFTGDAPVIDTAAFTSVTATARYPRSADGWEYAKAQYYSGNLTWQMYCDNEPHRFIHHVTEPTCLEQGYTLHACDYCDVTYIDSYVDPLGHDMGSWTPEWEAGCEYDGQLIRTCTRSGCDYSETMVDPATGHNYVDGICANCGGWELLGTGYCGSKITWEMYGNGHLWIYGTGRMYDFGNTGAPWDAYLEKIKWVQIDPGITYIGEYAFQYGVNIESFNVPHTVTDIGQRAFAFCKTITGISLPEKLTRISAGLFYGCENIGDIWIPDPVRVIEKEAFAGCSRFFHCSIPAGVTSIGDSAFMHCPSLTCLEIPKSVKSIGSHAFYYCTGLDNITIGENVTTIGTRAFYGCSNLTAVFFGGTMRQWTSLACDVGDAYVYCDKLDEPMVTKIESTASGIKLTWDAVDRVEKYRVFVKTSSGWSKVGDTADNSFTYTAAKAGTAYTFTVRGIGADGSFVTTYNTTGWGHKYAPTPVISKLESTTGGIKLTWGKINGAGKYRVFVKTSSGWVKLADTTATSYTYTGAKAGLTYTFTVRPMNAAGTAFVGGYNTTGWSHKYAPTPVISKLESTTGGIKLTWGKINGAGKYRVFVKTSSGWVKLADTASTSYTYTGAKAGVTYRFTVRPMNAAGTAFVGGYNTTGWSHKYAPTPVISKLESTTGGIKLTWGKVSGAGKYRVFVKTSSGWVKLADTASTSYTYTGAKAGLTYTFTVRPMNAAGTAFVGGYNTTGWSHQYTPTPVISKLESTTGGIKLTWGKINGAGKYRVFVKTSNGWTKVGDTTATTFTWAGAKAGTTYTFTVRAMNAEANAYVSAFNTTGWKHTFLPVPGVKLANTTKGIQISWGAINGAGKYRVFVKTSSGWVKVGDTTGTSFVWTGAQSGKTYTFTVRGMNAGATAYVTDYNTTGWSIKRQ